MLIYRIVSYRIVLGPLLFLMFVNELPLWIKNELRMFADDTKIWCKIMSEKDGATLQEDLDNLTIWSNTWQLKFNAEKCKVMHIGHSFETEYYMTDGSSGKKKLESVQEERETWVSSLDQISSPAVSVQNQQQLREESLEWSGAPSGTWI